MTRRTAIALAVMLAGISACSRDDEPSTTGPSTTAPVEVLGDTTAASTSAPTTAPTTIAAPTTTVAPATTTAPVDPRAAFDAFVHPDSMGVDYPFLGTAATSGGLFEAVADDATCQPARILVDSDDPDLAGWQVFEYAAPPAEVSINLAAADPTLVSAAVEAHRAGLVEQISCQERSLQAVLGLPTLTIAPVGVTELPGLGTDAVWVEGSMSIPDFGMENLRTVQIVMGYGPLAAFAVLPDVGPAEITAIAADLAARLIAAVDG